MEISAATDAVHIRLNSGIFKRQLPGAVSYKHRCAIGNPFLLQETNCKQCRPTQAPLYLTKRLPALAKELPPFLSNLPIKIKPISLAYTMNW